MKTKQLLFVTILSLVIVSCATKKVKDDKLFNTSWELDFISGSRIAFNGLFPDKKPKIIFNKETKKVEGTNSCNHYSADYILKGDAISFGEPGPTTMMYCGEGENEFLNTIKKINKYSFDNEGKLNLMINNVPMMRFKKAN